MADPEPLAAALSVSELTERLRLHLEEKFGWVQVRGEISNCKKAPSGHWYFRLKDDEAVLECVAWKTTAVRWGGLALEDGVEVIASGKITVYPPRGQYQLVVTAIRPAGAGLLQQRFELLKQRLAAEGLFDAERKRPLPACPWRIAVITSPAGAAIQDFLKIIRSYSCPVEITVCPVLVQGPEAAREIADMIRKVNRLAGHDVIVVCRGGGSLEDLWAFNEELTARAIFQSDIPVISAVGHEIDFTIADFVADVRAPTPTAAAQLITGLFERHRERLRLLNDRLGRSLLPRINRLKERLAVTQSAIRRYHPLAVVEQHRLRLDDFLSRMARAIRAAVERGRLTCGSGRKALRVGIGHEIGLLRQRVERDNRLLESYDPARNLARGYAVCRDEAGRVVSRIEAVRTDVRVRIVVSDGWFGARVMEVNRKS
ncbi:MAG: exodeoxyribonuclease VII large subunit [bacterium]